MSSGQVGSDTIIDYLQNIALLISDDERGLFRGHASVKWRLVPAVYRPDRLGITDYKTLGRWKRLAGRYANPRPANDLEWLALAQHFAVPTPLLDWTTNPLVALYFACEHSPKKEPGVVIMAGDSDFEFLEDGPFLDLFKSDRSPPGMIDAGAMNPRSSAQDSMMSLHSPGCDFTAGEHAGFFEVPHDHKWSTRTALRKFGITADRVFADLPLAARGFVDQLEWESLL